LALAAASFGLGFYFGQRPVGTLEQTVDDLQKSLKQMSRNVFDTTMGIEHDLRRRQALLDTKAHVVQAKSELFNKNFGEAAKQLAEGVTTLESAMKTAKNDATTQSEKKLIDTLQELRLTLSMGKKIPMRRLDDLQRAIDRELGK
jgi:uncharacterized protein YoxC